MGQNLPDKTTGYLRCAWSDPHRPNLIIGETDFADAVQALAPAQEKLGREVNPVLMSRAQTAGKVASADRFILRIFEEPKIYLIGGADDLGKLASDRPAEAARD